MSIKQKDIIELDLIIGIAAANNSTLNGNSGIERSYKTLVKLISDNKRMKKIISEASKLMNIAYTEPDDAPNDAYYHLYDDQAANQAHRVLLGGSAPKYTKFKLKKIEGS